MKALVIGAAGGFGGGMARALLRRGHQVRALARPGGHVPALEGAEIVTGDALDFAAVDRAAEGMDIIVWGFHLPYPKWVPGAVESARITAAVARSRKLTVLVPGNLYGLGGGFADKVSESVPKRPRSVLGHIRNQIEGLFREATLGGGQVIVLRAGDFLGHGLENSWFSMMTGRVNQGGRILEPAKRPVPHAWAFLPDVVRAGALLLEKRGDLAPFEEFHFDGYSLDTEALADSVRRVIGDPDRGILRIPWWIVSALSLFSATLRLILSVRYLWDEPLLLDGSKLARTVPEFAVTPLDDAVAEALGPVPARRPAEAELRRA